MAKAGQIDLFTRRVKKMPPIKERALHIAIADTLRVGCRTDWLWTHFPAGELRSDVTGALLKRMGLGIGWSDFLLVGPPRGQLHALELKREGMKPSRAQLNFLERLEGAGGRTACVDNYDDAIKALRLWGRFGGSAEVVS